MPACVADGRSSWRKAWARNTPPFPIWWARANMQPQSISAAMDLKLETWRRSICRTLRRELWSRRIPSAGREGLCFTQNWPGSFRSDNAEQYVMPSFVGKPAQESAEILEQAGFKLGNGAEARKRPIASEARATELTGIVVKQWPAGGAKNCRRKQGVFRNQEMKIYACPFQNGSKETITRLNARNGPQKSPCSQLINILAR